MERTTKLEVGKSTFETPIYLVYTRNGTVPNITSDILEDLLSPSIFSLTFWDLNQNLSVIKKFQSEEKKELKDYYNMNKFTFFIQTRDPLHKNSNYKITDNFVYGETQNGVQKLKFEEYFQAIKTLNPEFFSCIYDLHPKKDKSNLLLSIGKKYAMKEKDSKMFVSFLGCKNENTLERIKKFTKEIDDSVYGITFQDLGKNQKEVLDNLEKCVQILDKEHSSKPRMICGQDHPHLILESIERGVDIFDGCFPFISADFGYALIFPIDIVNKKYDMTMNLRDLKYELDTAPLVEGCKCLTCKDHTRAYIHHLLNTKEMTGDVLLTM